MNFQDKQQLVKLFLKKGYQLDKTAMNLLQDTKNTTDDIVSKLDASQPETLTLTGNDLRKLIENKDNTVHILREYKKPETPYSPDMVLKVLNTRYDVLKEALVKKPELTNLTSINKTKQAGQFSIIGIVRDITAEGTVIIEDNTGVIGVLVEKEHLKHLVSDEVVGLVCNRDNDFIKAEKVVYPDFNMKKAIQKTQQDIRLNILQYSHLDAITKSEKSHESYRKWIQSLTENDIIIVFGEASGKQELLMEIPQQNKVFLIGGKPSAERENTQSAKSSTAILKSGEVTIFVGGDVDKYKERFGTNEEETAKLLLKKRHLDPVLDLSKVLYEQDPYLLDIEPDIVVMSAAETTTANYKGTTILLVSNGKPVFLKAHLKTRETLKVDIA